MVLKVYQNPKARGIFVSVTVHTLLLLMLYLSVIRTPLPIGGESGIEVNLGFSEDGMGDQQSLIAAPEGPQLNQSEMAAAAASSPVKSEQGNVITQSVEEAPVIQSKNQTSTTVSPTVDKQSTNTNITQEVRQSVDNKSMFPGKKAGTQGGGGGSNEGETGKAGDQGALTGNPFSKNRGEGGSGGTTSGTGNTDYSLAGRSIVQKTTFTGKWENEGKIVVRIWVDKVGTVIRATAGAPGTTVNDSELWKKAEQAAMGAKFNHDTDGEVEQRGTITFRLGFQN